LNLAALAEIPVRYVLRHGLPGREASRGEIGDRMCLAALNFWASKGDRYL
jgi:hypothetical protein